MTLQEIINDRKMLKEDIWFDIEDLKTELDVYHLDINYTKLKEQKQLRCYDYVNWQCTDTYVGGVLYFLDDEFVFATWQSARKSGVNYYWKDKESVIKVKKYLESISDQNEDDYFNRFEFIEEQEYSKDDALGITQNFSSQVVDNFVIHKDTNSFCKVIKQYNGWNKEKFGDCEIYFITIQFPNKEIKTVKMSEILIPYKNVTKLHFQQINFDHFIYYQSPKLREKIGQFDSKKYDIHTASDLVDVYEGRKEVPWYIEEAVIDFLERTKVGE